MPRACAPAATVCVLGCLLCGVNEASHVEQGSTTDAMPLPLLEKIHEVPSQTHDEVPPGTQASTLRDAEATPQEGVTEASSCTVQRRVNERELGNEFLMGLKNPGHDV